MNVPDGQPGELIKLANEIENGSVAAEAITFEDAIEGILPVVLNRHRRMIADEVRDFSRRRRDSLDGATYAAYCDVADRIERGAL